jgi:hypothetical protein
MRIRTLGYRSSARYSVTARVMGGDVDKTKKLREIRRSQAHSDLRTLNLTVRMSDNVLGKDP